MFKPKPCKNCGKPKPRIKGRKYCDECTNFHTNKQYQQDYIKKYPERYIFWRIKQYSKEKGIPFNLDYDDCKAPQYCSILGIELKRNFGHKSYASHSPSVDRIDPKGGYLKGNIQVISQRANVMKNDASVEELQRFAQWVLKTYPL